MDFQQFYLGCLAHASYLIGSRGEAAVVDPRRDVDEYALEADRRGLRIRRGVVCFTRDGKTPRVASGQCDLDSCAAFP
jgi:hypothetical protein